MTTRPRHMAADHHFRATQKLATRAGLQQFRHSHSPSPYSVDLGSGWEVSYWPHPVMSNITFDVHDKMRWQRDLAADAAFELRQNPLAAASVLSAVAWLRAIGLDSIPSKPMVSANDNGTFSLEWETNTAVLHIMFEGERGEAYFSDGTDEWETDVDAGADKLYRALRTFS